MEIKNSAPINSVSFQGHGSKVKEVNSQNTTTTPIKDGNKKLKYALAGLAAAGVAAVAIGIAIHHGKGAKATQQASESAQKVVQETKEAVQKESVKTVKPAKLEIGESKTLSSGTKYTKNADGFTREFTDGRVETVHFLKDGTKVVENSKGFDVTLKDNVASKHYDIPQAPSPKGEQLGKTISTEDGSIIKRFKNGFSVEHGGVTKFYEGSNGLDKLTKENLDDYMVQQCTPEIQKMISEYLAKNGL